MQTEVEIMNPFLSYVYFLVFLIACRRIIRISHLQISCCDKGSDVFGYIFCMIDNTGSFQNFPTCSWHATEVYYVLLFFRQWHSFSVRVSKFSVMVDVRVTIKSVRVRAKSVMVDDYFLNKSEWVPVSSKHRINSSHYCPIK